jgi:hypothetical protein
MYIKCNSELITMEYLLNFACFLFFYAGINIEPPTFSLSNNNVVAELVFSVNAECLRDTTIEDVIVTKLAKDTAIPILLCQFLHPSDRYGCVPPKQQENTCNCIPDKKQYQVKSVLNSPKDVETWLIKVNGNKPFTERSISIYAQSAHFPEVGSEDASTETPSNTTATGLNIFF